jgi:hypothetical protein
LVSRPIIDRTTPRRARRMGLLEPMERSVEDVRAILPKSTNWAA